MILESQLIQKDLVGSLINFMQSHRDIKLKSSSAFDAQLRKRLRYTMSATEKLASVPSVKLVDMLFRSTACSKIEVYNPFQSEVVAQSVSGKQVMGSEATYIADAEDSPKNICLRDLLRTQRNRDRVNEEQHISELPPPSALGHASSSRFALAHQDMSGLGLQQTSKEQEGISNMIPGSDESTAEKSDFLEQRISQTSKLNWLRAKVKNVLPLKRMAESLQKLWRSAMGQTEDWVKLGDTAFKFLRKPPPSDTRGFFGRRRSKDTALREYEDFESSFVAQSKQLLLETAAEQTSERLLLAPDEIDKLRRPEVRAHLAPTLEAFLDKERTRIRARQRYILKKMAHNKREKGDRIEISVENLAAEQAQEDIENGEESNEETEAAIDASSVLGEHRPCDADFPFVMNDIDSLFFRGLTAEKILDRVDVAFCRRRLRAWDRGVLGATSSGQPLATEIVVEDLFFDATELEKGTTVTSLIDSDTDEPGSNRDARRGDEFDIEKDGAIFESHSKRSGMNLELKANAFKVYREKLLKKRIFEGFASILQAQTGITPPAKFSLVKFFSRSSFEERITHVTKLFEKSETHRQQFINAFEDEIEAKAKNLSSVAFEREFLRSPASMLRTALKVFVSSVFIGAGSASAFHIPVSNFLQKDRLSNCSVGVGKYLELSHSNGANIAISKSKRNTLAVQEK